MKQSTIAALGVAVAAGVAMAPVSGALADDVADFYKGKTLSLYVGVSPGGLYSTFALMAARHMGQYIPGQPTVVVQHMPGAGGTKAVSYAYSVAPKDGTVAITPNSSVDKRVVLKIGNPKYDPAKMRWLGGWGEAVYTLSLRREGAPVQTLQEALKTEVVLGAIGKTSGPSLIPALMNNVMGTKFKIITGYRGGSPIRLAIEKGEVDGWCGQWLGWKLTKPDWVRDGKLIHLVQLASKRAFDLQDVPLLSEFAKTAEERQMYRFVETGISDRAFVLAPGVPDDRAKALQDAYFKLLKDPDFLAEARQHKYNIDPIPGEQIQNYVNEIMSMPEATVTKLRKAMGLI
jgi:tripartite-type tricarboxylate transporter receptor subunit TctC